MKIRIILVLAIVLCGLVWLLNAKTDTVQQPVKTKLNAAVTVAEAQPRPVEVPAATPPSVPDPVPATGKTEAPSVVVAPKQPVVVEAPPAPPVVAPEAKPAPKPEKPAGPLFPEPTARQALNFVGADPIAEMVWIQAINDPALSRKARKNLIEDLNEDGFPNPKRITPDDLPLIMSRILLIEELAPYAMDDANAAAFREAHKDLVNMFYRLTRR